MKLLFEDHTFSFELLRTLSYAPYGGADISEVLNVGNHIKSGSFESWYENWHRLADKTRNQGQLFETSGELVSAQSNYPKAANYYRTAEFFLHGTPTDSRLMDSWQASRDTFWQAMQLTPQRVERLHIPFEHTVLPAYFYMVDDQPRPTLIVHGGYDSTGEELYFQVAQDALTRGYNVLTFEGPGQGAMIREQQIAFRPDWENVVSPVVDYLLTRPEVMADQISLMGISFGGLLAARAAAFEHRLATLILDDGVFSFDFGDAFRARSKGALSDKEVTEKVHRLMHQSTNVRWVIENGMFTFGAQTVSELFTKTADYSLINVASEIQCPTLVCGATGDMFFKGQPERVANALTAPTTLMMFDETEGAEEHCHMGALKLYNQRVFEWLTDKLSVETTK